MYRSPASTADIEPNHKMNKHVHSKLRCRLAENKVEKQVSIAHKPGQLPRYLKNQRTSKFESHICLSNLEFLWFFSRYTARMFENCEPTAPVFEENQTDSVQIEGTRNEIDQ